jgi:hypothetical protein
MVHIVSPKIIIASVVAERVEETKRLKKYAYTFFSSSIVRLAEKVSLALLIVFIFATTTNNCMFGWLATLFPEHHTVHWRQIGFFLHFRCLIILSILF